MVETFFVKGRIVAETSFMYHMFCVADAVTGRVDEADIVCGSLLIDTSGAVVWLGSEAGHGPFSSRDIVALRDVARRPFFDSDEVHTDPAHPMYPTLMDLRYGVLLASTEPDVVHVVRFDK